MLSSSDDASVRCSLADWARFMAVAVPRDGSLGITSGISVAWKSSAENTIAKEMFYYTFCMPYKSFYMGTSVSGVGQRALGSWMPCSPDATGGFFVPLLGHREGLRALSPVLYQLSSKSQVLLFGGNFTWKGNRNSYLSSSCTLHLVYHDISSGKIFGKGEFVLAQLKR